MDKAPTTKTTSEASEEKGSRTTSVLGNFGTNGSPLLADAWLDLDRGALPIWHESIPLPVGTKSFTVSLADVRYEQVPAEIIRQIPELRNVGTEPVVRTEVGMERKVPVGHVSIEPFRISRGSGQVERLVEFRMNIARTGASGTPARPKSYPADSKLGSGSWYRFSVFQEGVYKITYANLQAMGVDMNGLASDRINIYGNHFGLLPFENNVERPTDLMANAVEIVDGGDGNMGSNDYILFYASSAQRWEPSDDGFRHIKNVYCDSATYFVGVDIDPPVRIGAASLSDDPATATVTAFNDRQFIERDLANLIKSGRTWYGEYFDLVTSYTFNFNIPFPVVGDTSVLRVAGVGRTLGTANSSSFSITSGSGLTSNFTVQGVSTNYTGSWGRGFNQRIPFLASASPLSLTLTWNKFNPITSVAYLDFLELNCRRELRMVGSQMGFRDLGSVAPGAVAEFILDQAQAVTRIWEVTKPTDARRVDFTADGTAKRFRLATDSLREFIAFRDADFLSPTPVGRVPNQNLHATTIPTEMIIVCPPEFQSAAVRLAERRQSEGLSVHVVSPQQVYNEFSSGARDATAIKRYMRMLYDRAGSDPWLFPRYLLLFGDGSYNNLSVAPVNQNYIPSYQTEESLDPKKSYASDDYFGLLDATDGESPGDPMDIGVGRFPVSSLEQANAMVDKVLSYDQLKLLSLTGSSCSENGDGGLADWRTHVLFASDDQEGEGYEGIIHMSQSDGLARRVEDEYPELNVSKIYLDAYQQISTPGGERYPQAATELSNRVDKGLLVVNYVGHGGEVGWSHERFLDNSTILGWTNDDRLPLFMTATCEFTRWDDPGRTSAGEHVFLNPNGGGVGLMTTSRLAFSNANDELANKFYDHVFEDLDELGRLQRLGDISRKTKKDMSMTSSGAVNHRNFAVIGDPSMRLALPRNRIRISAITDTLGTPMDTLKALSTLRVQGFVDDGSGQPMADFNGVVIPIVYDKEQQQATLANDGGVPFLFKLRNNIIYRGRATVTNGQFNFTFVVPRDINYQVGTGRISCYAESMSQNAGGYDNDPLIGSTATDVAEDATGPVVHLFMNDENFVPGGMTDEDPLLFGKLFDENGINTVGSSIGHDLLAVLDENTEQAIVLNDLYESDLDTYKSGEVRYRLSDLAEGAHTLRLKAWDVFNNSTEATTDFVVSSSAELALDHVLNYPNPFTTHTEFYFEHNRPCVNLDVQVQVFTVSGRLVKTISRQLACNGYRSEGLPWNGLDDFGDKLGRGVYVYRLNVATPDGERAEKFEKLVILR
ncbi:MAG: type IX secretion system sortase PorU [Flavobacteriales bacterium]|nr:type IX secretion system sortase PorU [Flavobacteriales bacterium]MBK6883552.1 type IX secretion system sortase PorU [Flavobacteriales bacterium]MBK7113015.1 type IX secretion system sortase PorU [Flavobacteriales bacterium]MBK8533307.1 type IX secretion system sortase PorU [Flavobacteriales bacterium]HQW05241.1 type IX secretion system sortase PorU [Flavobacteriales bacterium]